MAKRFSQLDKREVLARKLAGLEKVAPWIRPAEEGGFFVAHDRGKLRKVTNKDQLQTSERTPELSSGAPQGTVDSGHDVRSNHRDLINDEGIEIAKHLAIAGVDSLVRC